MPANALTGHVGAGVSLGKNKKITWNAGADWNNQLSNTVKFRVTASDFAPVGNMVFIPGGTFQMGDAFTEGDSDERPVHSVYVSGFYLQNTEVTNDQMVEVLNWAYGQGKLVVSTATVKNAAGNQQELVDLDDSDCRILWNATLNRFEMKAAKGSGYPCVEVTWYGSAAWCNYRSEMEGYTPCYSFTDWSCNWNASGYRLPTEAEWEKAARGGLSGKRFPWGDIINHSYANYYNSSYSYESPQNQGYHPTYAVNGYPYTSPVGSFPANGYGLYDMAGNLWEWCWDWYSGGYYGTSPGTDPRGPTSGSYRVGRGGYWVNGAGYCRAADRSDDYPTDSDSYVGFRPARSSVP
jgi:formylglycine-generating enzyme required for sulfatase activity